MHGQADQDRRKGDDDGVSDHPLLYPVPLLLRHVSRLRDPEDCQDETGGHVDEIRVDEKEIRRAKEHRPFPVGKGIAAGAQGRHQRRCDRNPGDDVVGLVLSRLPDDAGNAACRGDDDVEKRGIGPCEQLCRCGLCRGEQKVQKRGTERVQNLEEKAIKRLSDQGIVGRYGAVGRAEDGSHQRGDQHGTDDDCCRVRVEANRGNQDRAHHDAHVCSGDLPA